MTPRNEAQAVAVAIREQAHIDRRAPIAHVPSLVKAERKSERREYHKRLRRA